MAYQRNWKHIKEEVMGKGLIANFNTKKHMRDKLISTGNNEIIEHYEHDSYWSDGGGQGRGQNKMRHLLMRLRMQLRHPTDG